MEGWDEALHEIGKLSGETIIPSERASSLVKAVQDLPILVVTGAEDALVSLRSAQTMASKFVDSVSILFALLLRKLCRYFYLFRVLNCYSISCPKWWGCNLGVYRLSTAPSRSPLRWFVKAFSVLLGTSTKFREAEGFDMDFELLVKILFENKPNYCLKIRQYSWKILFN